LLLLLLLFCAVFLLIDTTHEMPGFGVSQKQQQPQILTIDPGPSKKISRVGYGLCTNFIVYALRRKKSATSRPNTLKREAFIFISCFFDHVASISSVRRRNRIFVRTHFFARRSTASENETSLRTPPPRPSKYCRVERCPISQGAPTQLSGSCPKPLGAREPRGVASIMVLSTKGGLNHAGGLLAKH
jgi:hypothetical protein